MPSTYQCDSCGLGVCAGWFHYHDITADGFGSSTLAYCAACGTCYRIDHATTGRSSRRLSARDRSITDGERARLGLGTSLSTALVFVPALALYRASQGDPLRDLIKGAVVTVPISFVLGFILLELCNIVVPRSMRILAMLHRSHKARLVALGAAVGLLSAAAGAATAAAIWRAGGVQAITAALYAALAVIVIIEVSLFHFIACRGRRRPPPSLWSQATRGIRAMRARRRKRPEPAALPPDRMWRQPGPVDMPTDDPGSDPNFVEWLPFDPGRDIRPTRNKRWRGTLEGVKHMLLLADVQCATCHVKGAIRDEGPSRHPCPRCRKGMLEMRSAWMS